MKCTYRRGADFASSVAQLRTEIKKIAKNARRFCHHGVSSYYFANFVSDKVVEIQSLRPTEIWQL